MSDAFSFIKLMKGGRVGVIGIGGGGDIASAYVLCRLFEDFFDVGSCTPIAVLWERWVVDPTPGPVPKVLVRNAELGECVYVCGDTYVSRGLYSFKPQAAVLASLSGCVVPSVTLEYGVSGFRRCLSELVRRYGIDLFVGLDVGGDVLARGWEEGLGSPLADSMSLAALTSFNSVIAVLAPGADGELPQEYVLSRVSELAREGGYLGALGLWSNYVELMERVTSAIETEASKVPLTALKGYNGHQTLRSGLRKAKVNIISTLIFIIKTQTLYKQSPLAQKITNSKNLAEAVKGAEELGITTEFHSELRKAKASKLISKQQIK